MKRIAIIYTGGTIGMIEDPHSGALRPISAESILSQVPELSKFNLQFDVISTQKPIDSSEVDISNWQEMALLISQMRESVSGIVLLHGTDTMAYTASALSFMLENIDIPIIITGSQLPMGQLRTDGKENLISAIEIAAMDDHGGPMIQEVCIYFQSKLFRGNRTLKYSTEHFDAFVSPNYGALAEVGIHVNVNRELLFRPQGPFMQHTAMSNDVALLTMFPGMGKNYVTAMLQAKDLRGLVLETYGAGNSTVATWFIDALNHLVGRGIPVLNITQCNKGAVDQTMYETGRILMDHGVIGGGDLTREAAVTKMMFLLGMNLSYNQQVQCLQISLRGELSNSPA